VRTGALVVVVILGAILASSSGLAYAERDMCRRGTKYHGAPIDLDVKDADIHDVMRLLADVGGVNIVVADNVRGKVTLRLKRVAWDLAACTIAAVHKLHVTVQDNVVLVRKP
jgi:type II secretory pathway component HofQ